MKNIKYRSEGLFASSLALMVLAVISQLFGFPIYIGTIVFAVLLIVILIGFVLLIKEIIHKDLKPMSVVLLVLLMFVSQPFIYFFGVLLLYKLSGSHSF